MTDRGCAFVSPCSLLFNPHYLFGVRVIQIYIDSRLKVTNEDIFHTFKWMNHGRLLPISSLRNPKDSIANTLGFLDCFQTSQIPLQMVNASVERFADKVDYIVGSVE